MSSTRQPPYSTTLVSALNFSRWMGLFSFSPSASAVIKPTLWRVFSYLSPGLPRKTTIQSSEELFLLVPKSDMTIGYLKSEKSGNA